MCHLNESLPITLTDNILIIRSGTSVDDVVAAHTTTQHVAGLPLDMGGSGNSSPVTAASAFASMRTVARDLLGA